MRFLATIILAAALCLGPVARAEAWTPWGAIYGAARDERSVGTMAKDKKISADIKTRLLDRDKDKALKVKVYCFKGRVFLVGRLADEAFKSFALDTARAADGVSGVETFWAPLAGDEDLAADLKLEAKVRAVLVADGELSSTQIETEVYGDTVVLLGLVRDKKDAARAVTDAESVTGVGRVKSFLRAP
ncbi:MAG: BON domain-containing protein [Desulfovibrionaceae bacterium]|nr:BON domain-containing protein [Desulfovibrionaceae bacterium]